MRTICRPKTMMIRRKIMDSDLDRCCILGCPEQTGLITYTFAGLSVGVCPKHYHQHCCKVPTVNLKTICQELADAKTE